MTDLNNLDRFARIDQSQFENAVNNAASKPAGQLARRVAGTVLPLLNKQPIMQIGDRVVPLKTLSKQLEQVCGMPSKTILQCLHAVQQKSSTYESSAHLLHAIRALNTENKTNQVQDAIAAIDDMKELFYALRSVRFVSNKEGTVINAKGEVALPSDEAKAQFGDSWNNSSVAKWLEGNPGDMKRVADFYNGLTGNKANLTPTSLNYFLKEVLGSHIKLDSKNKPVAASSEHSQLESYLTNHPELVRFINENKKELGSVQAGFVRHLSTLQPPIDDKLANLKNMLAAKYDLLEKLANERPAGFEARSKYIEESAKELEAKIHALDESARMNHLPLVKKLDNFLTNLAKAEGSTATKTAELNAFIQELLQDKNCSPAEGKVLLDVLRGVQENQGPPLTSSGKGG